MSQVCLEQNFLVGEKTISSSVAKMPLDKKGVTKRNNSLLKTVDNWVQRAHQRKKLSQLDSHLLKDLGLTEAMVAEGVAKPFWK